MSSQHVVLVEHDLFLQDIYARVLTHAGYRVSAVSGAQDCIDILDTATVDLVVSELQLGSNDGVEILHELRSYDDWMSIPFIALSNIPEHTYPHQNVSWARYGVHSFLYKPETDDFRLIRAARRALREGVLKQETAHEPL